MMIGIKTLLEKNIIPIVDREVKIISDNFVAIDQGSGALKVTPAHDFNDFDILDILLNLSSGTETIPIFGSIVQKGKFSA